jgi:hypothetical protein
MGSIPERIKKLKENFSIYTKVWTISVLKSRKAEKQKSRYPFRNISVF